MTTHPSQLKVEDYNYELPQERIAVFPLEERDASKLLVYKNTAITENQYKYLDQYIPDNALMVFNQSKVVHARLLFYKESGGAIELFCLEPVDTDVHTAMLRKGEAHWRCLVGGAARWKNNAVLGCINEDTGLKVYARELSRANGVFEIEFSWPDNNLCFAEILQQIGRVPLPPYLQREVSRNDESRYQTVFAKEEGSVAAPTAGLHFTSSLLQKLEQKGIAQSFVTLHVGAGTFKPVKSATLDGHDMHAEWIEVDRHTIQTLKDYTSRPVIAIGTTSLRTLESLYWIGAKLFLGKSIAFESIAVQQWDAYDLQGEALPALEQALDALLQYLDKSGLQRLVTRTQILIAPGYRFKVVQALLTNFHQPQSTLLFLVAAFIGDGWRDVYAYAMENDFRFLSYGDGSLLWRKDG